MLEIKNLQVAYGPLVALHAVDLIVRPCEMVALVGPNGAGKSTLLKTISGLLRPRAGAIRWQDETIDSAPPQHIVERGIALVPEGRRLFAAMDGFGRLVPGRCRACRRHEFRCAKLSERR